MSDNLSVYASSRNNHLIGEVAGLLVAGAKFPYLRRAPAQLRPELDARDPKMAGRVIGHVMKSATTGLDGAVVSKIVREELGAG